MSRRGIQRIPANWDAWTYEGRHFRRDSGRVWVRVGGGRRWWWVPSLDLIVGKTGL